jgi:hypothetical protein
MIEYGLEIMKPACLRSHTRFFCVRTAECRPDQDKSGSVLDALLRANYERPHKAAGRVEHRGEDSPTPPTAPVVRLVFKR